VRLAVIAPRKHLELSEQGDILFLLAQEVLVSDEYRNFFAKQKKYKILDNGAFELREPLLFEDILEAADLVDADEIVLPDYPLKPKKTVSAVKDFFSVCSNDEKNSYNFCAVPHGKTLKAFLKCYAELLTEYPHLITCIGWTIIDLHKYNFRLRPFAFFTVYHLYFSGLAPWCNFFKTEHHLLGLDEPQELLIYRPDLVRSVDTSLPVSLAFARKKLRFDTQTVNTKRVPLDATLSRATIRLASKNITKLQEAIR